MTKADDVDFKEYVSVVWRRRWTVLLSALVVLMLAAAYAATRTAEYTSAAQVLLKPGDPAESISAERANVDIGRFTNSQVLVMGSRRLAAAAAASLPEVTADEVLAAVTVTGDADGALITVEATSTDPERASAFADAVAVTYIEDRRITAVAGLQVAADRIGEQLDVLRSSINALEGPQNDAAREAATAQYGSLFTRQADLLIDLSLKRGEAEVIARASAPTTPNGLSLSTLLILALLLGLAVGVGLALVRDQYDDQLRSREEAESVTGLPVLAELPIDKMSGRFEQHLATVDAPGGPFSEATRSLRTSITFLGIDRPISRVMVTSPLPGDGKSTVALNLAASFAQAGLRTVLVSADLRRPRLERALRMSAGLPGLAELLTAVDPRHIRDALLQLTLPTAQPLLSLLPAGTTPHNPAEMLASQRMDMVLDELSSVFDMLVVDTSPVLAVTDAAALAPKVGNVVLVASLGITSSRALQSTVTVLSRSHSGLLGVVVNRSTPNQSYGGYGSYALTPFPNPPDVLWEPEHDDAASPSPASASWSPFEAHAEPGATTADAADVSWRASNNPDRFRPESGSPAA